MEMGVGREDVSTEMQPPKSSTLGSPKVTNRIMPGVVSGFLMSFTFSLDDFVISYFTSGSTSQTLPITIYSMTRRKISPEINALSTLIFVVVVIVLVVKHIIETKQEQRNRANGGDEE